ncbi:RHS repeat protein, partial [Arachnia propionica]
VTVVSDEDGSRSNTWVADARGRVVGITDSDGNHSTMAYDQWGNQVLATDPEGNTTARAFDERGRLIIEQLPSGAVTRLGYDELDRLTEIISLEDGTEVARTCMSYTGAQQQPSTI